MGKNVRKNDLPAVEGRFGVILENIDSNVKQVLEGHAVLDKKIDDFRQEFDESREETNWKFEQVLLEGRMQILEERLAKSRK